MNPGPLRRTIMKAVSILSLVVTLLIAQLAGAAEADGFRGLTWGTEFETVKDVMTCVGKDSSFGGIDLCTRNGDELKIGGADLESIVYGFWQGRLSDVRISITGFSNYENLRAAMVERFGRPYKPNRYMDDYLWSGKVTTMSMRYNKVAGNGRVLMYSVETSAKQKEYSATNAKKGAESGF
jgi:hypothetical protein